MKGIKPLLYLSLALGMLLFAVPQLQVGGGVTLPTLFSVIWLVFALTIIAAHLHELLGVNEETEARVTQVKRMRVWQAERQMRGSNGFLRMKK